MKIRNKPIDELIVPGNKIPEMFTEFAEHVLNKYKELSGIEETTMTLKFQISCDDPNIIECEVKNIPGSNFFKTCTHEIDHVTRIDEDFTSLMGISNNNHYYYAYTIQTTKNKLMKTTLHDGIINRFRKMATTKDFQNLIYDVVSTNFDYFKDKETVYKAITTALNNNYIVYTIDYLLQKYKYEFIKCIDKMYDPMLFGNIYMYLITNIDKFMHDTEKELLFKLYVEKLIPLTVDLVLNNLSDVTGLTSI